MFYDKYFYSNNPADLSNTIVISELLVINNIFKTVLTRLGRSRKFRKKGLKKLRGSPVHRKIWTMEILFISAQCNFCWDINYTM